MLRKHFKTSIKNCEILINWHDITLSYLQTIQINYDFYWMRKLFLQTNTSRTINKKWRLWHLHVMRRVLTLLTGMSLALYHGSTVRIIWLSRALQSESGYLSVHFLWIEVKFCYWIIQYTIYVVAKYWGVCGNTLTKNSYFQ